DGLRGLGEVAALISRSPGPDETTSVAAGIAHRAVTVGDSHPAAGVAAGGAARRVRIGRSGAFHRRIRHVGNGWRGRIDNGDGLRGLGEVAALISRSPGPDEATSVAAGIAHRAVTVG